MDQEKAEEYIFSLKTAKMIGLYQILDQSSKKFWGYNIYCVAFMAVTFIVDCIPAMVFSIGLYVWRNDTLTFFYNIATVGNISFAFFKNCMLAYNSKDLWNCVEVTSFNFLSHYQHYNGDLSKQARNRVIRLTNAYGMLMIIVSIFWILSPIILSGTAVNLKNVNNSYSTYRLNLLNPYILVSSETYNDYFFIFYFIEMIIVISVTFFYYLVDIFIVSVCFALSCHMEKICEAIRLLGYSTHLTADNGIIYFFYY